MNYVTRNWTGFFGVMQVALLVALLAIGAPAVAGPGATFSIQAENANGAAEFRVDCNAELCLLEDGTMAWSLEKAMVLRDPESHRPIATLESASLGVVGATVILNFLVSTASPSVFTVSSAPTGFDPVMGAARATAAVSVTDSVGDGASLTGNFPDGSLYRAFVTDAMAKGEPTESVFASLLSDVTSSNPITSLVAEDAYPAIGGTTTMTQSGSPLGIIASARSEFRFGVNGGNSASGTSVLIVEPAAKLNIVAESVNGTAYLDLPLSGFTRDGEGWSWTQEEAVEIVDEADGRSVGVLRSATLAVTGSKVNLNFLVSSGGGGNFTVTSANVSFPAIANARGRATATLTGTDFGGTGIDVSGNFAGDELYRAFYNDPGNVPSTGTTFATLLAGESTTEPFSSVVGTDEFGAAGAFSSSDESGAPLTTVSSMSAQFQFQINAGSSASGTSTFAITGCGNGDLDDGEACDDGNATAGDGCSPSCAIEECGNGILDPGEDCDDGNTVDGDGCNANCRDDFCGDGIVTPPEQCDDGNNDDGDGCQGNCQNPFCGDGIHDIGEGEQCDDGNNVDADGCQGNCLLPACGDGIVDAGEGCDDGNNVDLDGCGANCQLEGACCSDGPLTESECFIATEEACNANGNSALYLGDGTTCTSAIDCFALAVEMDSMSAEATPDGILVRWTTAMEIDTVAFRILREMPATPENREKTIVVIAPSIAAMGNQLEGADYSFLDNVKESSLALHYYVEDVDVFGRVTRHGPIAIDRGERQVPATRTTRQR